MSNSSILHDFDHRLCRYVLDNLEPLLLPRIVGELEQEMDVVLLNFLKAEQQWEETADADLLLNWQELSELKEVSGLFASRLRWSSYPQLHRWHIRTISEIRDGLTCQTAEEWSRTCCGYGQRLATENLPLQAGIEMICDWTFDLRQHLLAMGRPDLLPAPDGGHPTPTNPAPQPATPRPPVTVANAGSSGDAGRVEPAEQPTSPKGGPILSGLEEECSVQEAADILCCDRKTVIRMIDDGQLEWRNAAPLSSTRAIYRLKASSVIELRNSYSRSGTEPPTLQVSKSPRRKASTSSGYKPTHIRRQSES